MLYLVVRVGEHADGHRAEPLAKGGPCCLEARAVRLERRCVAEPAAGPRQQRLDLANQLDNLVCIWSKERGEGGRCGVSEG